MRKFLMGAALVALTIPAAAQAGETYIGASGGISLPANSENRGQFTADVPATPDFGAIPSGTSLGWNTGFDTGWTISGQVGHAFENGFRVEAELAYSRYNVAGHNNLTVGGANIDSADVAVLTRGTPATTNPTVGAVIADGQGNVSNFGGYINLLYDIRTGGRFFPYVGGGIGYQRVDITYQPSGVPVGSGDDSSLAWQGIAGGSLVLSNHVDMFVQYTYRATFRRNTIALSLLPADLGVQSKQSLVTVGFRYRFGQ